MGIFVYDQLAAQSRVGMRAGCRTLSYGRREGGDALIRWSVEKMSDRARRLVESSSSASDVLLGTPHDIPRWCTATNLLVREGRRPYPRRIRTVCGRRYQDSNIFIFLVLKESPLKENLLVQNKSFVLIMVTQPV